MQRRLVIVVVVGFWAVMMATLVRRWLLDVRPEFEPGTYRSVLTRERRNYQWRKGIYFPGKKGLERVGYTQTVFHYRDNARYSIHNVTKARVALPGIFDAPVAFDLDVTATITSDYRLERLSVQLDSTPLKASGQGRLVDGNLVVRGTVNGQEQGPFELPLPKGEVAAQGFSPLLALPPLKAGMKWSAAVVDPFTLRPSRVELEVLRHEPLIWDGRRYNTFLIVIRSGPGGLLSARAWVTPEGDVLKEQTLLGLTLVKERIPEGGETAKDEPSGNGN